MIKKIGLLIAVLFISSTTCYGGYYIGISGGPEVATFYQHAHVTQPNPFTGGTSFNVIDATQFSGPGGFGSIFAGYNLYYRSRFYLAGELNANLSSATFIYANSEFVHQNFQNTQYQMEDSYGMSVLPGFLFTPCTLFYARLGLMAGHFRTTTPDTTLSNLNTYLGGLRLGVGIKQKLYPHLSFLMEYNHVSYQSITRLVIDGTTSKTTTYTPETSQVQFGLIYDFC